jgi:hypothetical protein
MRRLPLFHLPCCPVAGSLFVSNPRRCPVAGSRERPNDRGFDLRNQKEFQPLSSSGGLAAWRLSLSAPADAVPGDGRMADDEWARVHPSETSARAGVEPTVVDDRLAREDR